MMHKVQIIFEINFDDARLPDYFEIEGFDVTKSLEEQIIDAVDFDVANFLEALESEIPTKIKVIE